MITPTKVLALELWYFLGLPLLGVFLLGVFGLPGLFVYLFLGILWCWELFVFVHYRFCRQQEFFHVLQTAAATQAPFEAILRAYVEDRPREEWYRFLLAGLLCFVFPGYYWIHVRRSFDTRVIKVLDLLKSGVSLDRAFDFVPEVVSRETALAVTVGHFSGQMNRALKRLPDRRSAPPWLELAPRLMYPLLLVAVLASNVMFMMIFIIPKFEKIFADFKMKLPSSTDAPITLSRWPARSPWIVPLAWLLFLGLLNILLFSSRVKWYCPLVGRVYRLHVRGQFLQALGSMLETGKPLPDILERVLASGLLPHMMEYRVERLAADLSQGQPLPESLARHGLVTEDMRGLIVAAQQSQNLPWALQELGDTLSRRSARLSYRAAMVVFPLAIFFCACLIAFVAVSLFAPLAALLKGLGGA